MLSVKEQHKNPLFIILEKSFFVEWKKIKTNVKIFLCLEDSLGLMTIAY